MLHTVEYSKNEVLGCLYYASLKRRMLLHYPPFTKLNLCALRFYLTVFVFITKYLRQCQLWLVNYSHTHCLQTLFLIFNCVSIETKECFVVSIAIAAQIFPYIKFWIPISRTFVQGKFPREIGKGLHGHPRPLPPSLPPSITFIFFAWQTGDVWPRRRRIP